MAPKPFDRYVHSAADSIEELLQVPRHEDSSVFLYRGQSGLYGLEGDYSRQIPSLFRTIPSEDVTQDALSAGHGTEGNQFVFTGDNKWQFNLKTRDYTAAGTYTITMESGDGSEYLVDSCVAQFVINE